MTDIAHAGEPSRVGSVRRGWIQSPSYDLALFILAPLSGLVVLAADVVPGGYRIGIAALFLVAIPHYMSSFSFYLGDDNLPYYKSRWMAFFVGPALIFASVIVLRALEFHRPVQSTMFVWNVWHVSLQSAGILSIYRRLNGGPIEERRVAHLAILSVGATMAFWYPERFEPLFTLLTWVHPVAPWALRSVTLPLAFASLTVLLLRIARRPHRISLAEGAFLTTSLLLFHPYLWVDDSARATFAMLMGHFVQYLAIVWLLNHRKYAGRRRGSMHQRLLTAMSESPATVLGFVLVIGVTFYTADRLTTALGMGMVYVMIWNAMTLIHFYVDGLVWAFRTQHVRQTVGPHLMPTWRTQGL